MLQALGAGYEEYLLDGQGGASILVTIPGKPPAAAEDWLFPETLILALPLSKPGEAPGGLPYGVQTALRLIGRFQKQAPRRRLMVAFLGNEYPASLAEGEAHQGLEALYLLLDDPENSALIYLELFEPPGAVAVHYRAAGKTAPLILLRTLALIAEGRRIPYALAPPARYVQGADQQPSPLALTLSRELPSLLVRAAGGAERDRLGADLLAGLFEEYAGLLEWNAGGLDAHYIPLTRRGKTVFITEWGILLMIFSGLGAGAGIVLLYSAFRHHIAIPGRVDFFGNAAICAAIGGLFWAVCIDITRAAGCIGVLFFIAIGGVLPFPRGVFICAGCALLGTAGTLVISLRGQDAGVFTQTLFLLIAALLLALRGGLLIHNKAERRAAAGTAGSLDAGPPARNQRRPLGRR